MKLGKIAFIFATIMAITGSTVFAGDTAENAQEQEEIQDDLQKESAEETEKGILEGITKVETSGISFEIPEELAGMVTVKTDGLEDGMLVEVYETASVEAVKKQEEKNDGAGWLFGISRVSDDRLKELRCGGMDGMEVFAYDGKGTYLIYNHPTDVRFVRESYDNIEEDQEQWTKLNEWAYENVREEIIANDPELTPEVFTNTSLDMNLCRALYRGADYEVRSMEFGNQKPEMPDNDDYLEKLADWFVYQYGGDGVEVPNGDYYTLTFGNENVRYDFFLARDGENYVREIITYDEGGESESLYLSSPKSQDHLNETTTGIMKAWVDEILEK